VIDEDKAAAATSAGEGMRATPPPRGTGRASTSVVKKGPGRRRRRGNEGPHAEPKPSEALTPLRGPETVGPGSSSFDRRDPGASPEEAPRERGGTAALEYRAALEEDPALVDGAGGAADRCLAARGPGPGRGRLPGGRRDARRDDRTVRRAQDVIPEDLPGPTGVEVEFTA